METGKTEFVEQDCSVEFQGKKFESGGAFLLPESKTGKTSGILYASPKTGEVTDWHGTLRIKATFGPIWKSAFRDCDGFPQVNQSVSFEHAGKRFRGVWYNREWSEVVRVREVA